MSNSNPHGSAGYFIFNTTINNFQGGSVNKQQIKTPKATTRQFFQADFLRFLKLPHKIVTNSMTPCNQISSPLQDTTEKAQTAKKTPRIMTKPPKIQTVKRSDKIKVRTQSIVQGTNEAAQAQQQIARKIKTSNILTKHPSTSNLMSHKNSNKDVTQNFSPTDLTNHIKPSLGVTEREREGEGERICKSPEQEKANKSLSSSPVARHSPKQAPNTARIGGKENFNNMKMKDKRYSGLSALGGK